MKNILCLPWSLLVGLCLVSSVVDVEAARATTLILGKTKPDAKIDVLPTGEDNSTMPVAGVSAPGSSTSGNDTVLSVNGTKLTGVPQIDYILDPNLPRELNGFNLTEYPFYNALPEELDFKCDGLHDGFYASVPHKCQVYHHCLFGTRYDFLCANYTAFDQKTFICHFASEVDCKNSPKYYNRNEALYKSASTTTAPVLSAPIGGSKKPGGGEGGRRKRPFRKRKPQYEYYDDYEEYPAETDYDDTYDTGRRRKPPRPYNRDGYESEAVDDADRPLPSGPNKSLYDRPRVAPKIRRPVPINERDKYDYSGDARVIPAKEGKEQEHNQADTDKKQNNHDDDGGSKNRDADRDRDRPRERERERKPPKRRPENDQDDDYYGEEEVRRPRPSHRERTRYQDYDDYEYEERPYRSRGEQRGWDRDRGDRDNPDYRYDRDRQRNRDDYDRPRIRDRDRDRPSKNREYDDRPSRRDQDRIRDGEDVRPNRNRDDDRPSRNRNKDEDRPSREKDHKPSRNREDDRSSREKEDERPSRKKEDDRPSRNRDDDRSSREKEDERPSRNRDEDRSSREKEDDKPSRNREEDRSSREKEGDRPTRKKEEDRPIRNRDEERPNRNRNSEERPNRHREDTDRDSETEFKYKETKTTRTKNRESGEQTYDRSEENSKPSKVEETKRHKEMDRGQKVEEEAMRQSGESSEEIGKFSRSRPATPRTKEAKPNSQEVSERPERQERPDRLKNFSRPGNIQRVRITTPRIPESGSAEVPEDEKPVPAARPAYITKPDSVRSTPPRKMYGEPSTRRPAIAYRRPAPPTAPSALAATSPKLPQNPQSAPPLPPDYYDEDNPDLTDGNVRDKSSEVRDSSDGKNEDRVAALPDVIKTPRPFGFERETSKEREDVVRTAPKLKVPLEEASDSQELAPRAPKTPSTSTRRRPFLPSRGGNPNLPRGLQPVGAKTANTEPEVKPDVSVPTGVEFRAKVSAAIGVEQPRLSSHLYEPEETPEPLEPFPPVTPQPAKPDKPQTISFRPTLKTTDFPQLTLSDAHRPLSEPISSQEEKEPEEAPRNRPPVQFNQNAPVGHYITKNPYAFVQPVQKPPMIEQQLAQVGHLGQLAHLGPQTFYSENPKFRTTLTVPETFPPKPTTTTAINYNTATHLPTLYNPGPSAPIRPYKPKPEAETRHSNEYLIATGPGTQKNVNIKFPQSEDLDDTDEYDVSLNDALQPISTLHPRNVQTGIFLSNRPASGFKRRYQLGERQESGEVQTAPGPPPPPLNRTPPQKYPSQKLSASNVHQRYAPPSQPYQPLRPFNNPNGYFAIFTK